MIFLNKFFLKGATVDTDTDRNITFPGHIDHRLDPFPASNISRIDTNLVRAILHRSDRQSIIKMNICYQWNMNLFLDFLQCLCGLHCRHRTADDLAACCLQLKNLLYCCLHIFCLCVCHRLDKNRIASSNLSVSDLYYFGMIPVHKFPSIL